MYTIEPFNMKCNEQDCLNFYTPEINKVRAPNIVFNQEFLSDGQKYHDTTCPLFGKTELVFL